MKDEKMPKVSIITGFYNRGHLLERTIESILVQTFEDFELIVFDDKSTDGTSERLPELAAQYNDPRFRYIVHDENKGFVKGLRDAVADSTGEYIAIQGSGDVSLPTRLEKQVAVLDLRPEIAVVGGWYYDTLEGASERTLKKPNANDITFESLLDRNYFTHGEVMIRRTVYDEVGGYRTAFKYAQDRDLWLRISKVASFATISEPLYERLAQADGVSFVASKIWQQAGYSIAARRLAQMPEAEEAQALRLVEAEGPYSIVKRDDPLAQKYMTNASIRMIRSNAPHVGAEIARDYVTAPATRRLLLLLARVFESPRLKRFQPLIIRLGKTFRR